MVEKIFSYF